MLALTRKENETVIIFIEDKEVARFSISQIKGGKARLYFNAPKHVKIMRGELIAQNNKENTTNYLADN